jgi:hypothetical protein
MLLMDSKKRGPSWLAFQSGFVRLAGEVAQQEREDREKRKKEKKREEDRELELEEGEEKAGYRQQRPGHRSKMKTTDEKRQARSLQDKDEGGGR